MNKSNTLQKRYDVLTPLERVRLVLAARHRGDDQDVAALASTCPRGTYKMQESPFPEMLGAVERATWAVVTDILDTGLTLVMTWGLWRRHRAGDDDGADYFQSVVDLADQVLVLWRALGAFCDVVGITADQALATCPGRPARVVKFAETVQALDADFAGWLASDFLQLDADDQDRALDERDRVQTSRRQVAVDDLAGVLVEFFNRETGAGLPAPAG